MSLTNPLLQSQEPSYVDVELPSRGIVYEMMNNVDEIFEQGTLHNGKVQIRALTTKDELVWTDERLVEDLKAPVIVLKNIILGLKRPELLLRADVEALLLHSRVLTYGKYTKISWDCSQCGSQNEITADYTKLPIKTLNNVDDLILKFGNYELFMTPLIFEEAVEIQKANDNDITEQLDKIVSCIQRVDVKNGDKVDTVTDKGFIAQWVEQVNPKDFKKILDHFTKVNEIGTVTSLDVKCQHCNNKEKSEVIVDITNFFSEED